MFKILHLATLALLSSICNAVLPADKADFIFELTDENFDIEIGKKQVMLVEFYTPWCKHCQELEPDLLKVAAENDKIRPKAFIGRVDCAAQQELRARFKIKTFPTFKWFIKNQPEKDYTGPETYEGFYEYSRKFANIAEVIISNYQCHTLASQNYNEGDMHHRQVIYFGKPLKDNDHFFVQAARDMMDFEFVQIAGCNQFFKAKRGEIGLPRGDGSPHPTVGLSNNYFKQYDESKPLKEWILENFLPPVFKLTMFNNPETLTNMGADNLILWTNKEIPDAFRKAAEEFGPRMRFMIPDLESEFSLDYSKKFGADMEKIDYQIDLIQDNTWKHYSFDGDATNEQEIINFVQDFLDGKLKHLVQVKSQPIPNPSHEEGVKLLVGKTHDREVYSGKEHFIMYYAPWCGHCKNFKPTLEQFAAHVKDTDIVVAKIDMTENEVKDMKIKGYPTIFWYPKDPTAKKIAFEDNRSLEGIKQFALKNSVDYKNLFPNEKLKVSADSQDIPENDEDAVKVLVGLTHDKITKNPDNDALVMYYAPWCGHCKRLAPTWLQLAEHVVGSNVVIAKIDMTENKLKGLAVNSYPTLYYYEADKPKVAYEDGRELQDLKDFLVVNSKQYMKAFPDAKVFVEEVTSVVHLNSMNHDKITQDPTKDVFVSYTAPWCGHCKALKPTWVQLSDHVQGTDVVVANIDSTKHKTIFPEVKGFPTIYYYPKQGEPQAYEGGRTLQDLKDYLIRNSQAYKTAFPKEKLEEDEVTSVTVLDQQNHDQVTQDPQKDVLVMYYAPWCGHCKKLKPIWTQLSDHVLKSDVLIAKIDMTKNKLEAPEVKGFPTIYYYPKEGESQAYDGGRTLQDLKDYLIKNSSAYKTAFPNEKLEEEEVTSVTILDQKNHNQITQDASKDVFVMYYAPWCGHCKKLKPIWTQLSDYVLKSDVIVAKIDMTKNKLEAPEVKGFPTIYFYPKEGESQAYDGGRTLQDLKDYLIKNSSAYRLAFPKEKLEEEEVTSVTVLDQKNHDQVTKDATKDVFVMYYAPWCGHCKKLKPTWIQLSDYVQNTDVLIAKIDMTKNKLATPEVKGFPTIFFYPMGGDPESYDGGRTLQELKDYLIKNSSAYRTAFPKEKLEEEEITSVRVLDQKTHDQVTQDPTKDVLVMYYAPWCGHCKKLKPVWIELSDHVEKTQVLIAKIDMTKNKLATPEVKGFPTLYFYPMEGEPKVYEGDRNLQDFKNFLLKNSDEYREAFPNEKLPEPKQETIESAVTEIDSSKSHTQLTEDPTKDVFVLYYAPWCGHCKNLKPIWEELALHVLGSDIVVAQIDLTANALKSPEVEGYPTMYFYPKEGESKKYDSGRSLNDFRKFLFDNSAAYREAFPEEDANHVKKLKSQDPQPDDENIKVLVASSHNQAVYDKSKDTLVMYYAPWCGHCKKLAPHWKDLAKEVQGTNVVIAKIDMTENEIEGLRITSFPTIFFYPAGGERVAFDGGRDLNKLMEWLSKNSDQFKLSFPGWKPVAKTEKVPEKDELPPIKSIVGSNHNVIVNDPTKDVIVMYMASWCGHCKKLKPTWQLLAESLQGTNVLVSMIDASLNDQDLVQVTGFPTIYWYKSDAKKPVKFDGDRSLEGLQKWISGRMTDKTITFGAEPKVEEVLKANPDQEIVSQEEPKKQLSDEEKQQMMEKAKDMLQNKKDKRSEDQQENPDQPPESMKNIINGKKDKTTGGVPKDPEAAKEKLENFHKMSEGFKKGKKGQDGDSETENKDKKSKMKEKMQQMKETMKDKQEKEDL